MSYMIFEDFMTSIEYNIYCDMDGVLTDFEGDFKKINKEKLSPKEYEAKHGNNSFWKPIEDQGLKHWSQMTWMPDGQRLWKYILKHDPVILSAPSRDWASPKGKVMWINRQLGIKQKEATLSPKASRWHKDSRIILNSEKQLFVKSDKDILIDDTPKKIQNWKAAGGIGILHTSASSTIAELKKLGL